MINLEEFEEYHKVVIILAEERDQIARIFTYFPQI